MYTFEKDIPAEPPTSVDGEIVFVSNRQVSATWEEPNTNLIYEIFINWNEELNEDLSLAWTYMRTVSSPTYTTLAPVGTESARIWVQQPTSNQVKEDLALIFEDYADNTFAS